jgi:uncharacterized membrane protein YhhN
VSGPTTLTIAGLLAMLLGERLGWTKVVAVAKPTASTGFLWAAYDAGALQSTYGQLIGAGLVAGWVGDVALLSRKSSMFLVGLVSFALTHVLYSAAFWTLGVPWGIAGACALGLLGPAWMIYRWLRPHLPDDMVRPVIVYILIISVMVSLAGAVTVGGTTRLILMGAVTFFLSDISVARDRFVKTEFGNRLWGWPLYYAAQLLLAASIADQLTWA